MKTVGKCSLLTVISIKDIRFAVENHPQKSYLNIDLVEFRFYVRFAVFGHFFFVYLNYFENCWEMFTFYGYKHQGHSICSRKPPSKFVIGAFFRLYFKLKSYLISIGPVFPVLCKICRFRSFFFLFISIILKTVGKFSLLTSKTTLKVCNRSILSTSYVVQRNQKKKFQKSINNSKNTYLFENSTIHRKQIHKHFVKLQHQGHSICSRKPPSKFVIGAFFRLRFGRIPVLCKICRFRSFFFFVYVIYYENCWEMFTFNGYKHQGHSICSRKPPSKFVIGAFFRLVMLYKETKKKNFRNL
ncbi:hypothetical protein AGLY_017654 [Aphis glycines]|uniref:Uncharacterized protein n=1 Tax=Aphis glycines TaxID=307491 RepID=A0A6G0SUX0_APHGL|nr:hypothetical protein AGLY_017654 [Aphis glycines]